MSVLIAELYDALREAGASDDKARAAARAVSDNEARLSKLEGQIEGVRGELAGLKAQIEALKMRMDTFTWVLGLNAALAMAILVRTFFS